MPRPERSIDPSAGPAAAFAYQLRELQHECGLTLSELAEKTFYARSTLSVGLSGEKVPTWDVVNGIVKACGCTDSDEQLWRARWEAARQGRSPEDVKAATEQTGRSSKRRGTSRKPGYSRQRTQDSEAPDPRTARSMADLARQLDMLRQHRGLTWRRLAELSEDDQDDSTAGTSSVGPLAASSMHDAIVVREAPPLGLLLHVVQLCGGSPKELVEWGTRWAQIYGTQTGTSRQNRRHATAPTITGGEVFLNAVLRLLDYVSGSWTRTAQIIALMLVPIATLAVTISLVYLAKQKVAWPILVSSAGAFTISFMIVAASRSLRRRVRGHSYFEDDRT